MKFVIALIAAVAGTSGLRAEIRIYDRHVIFDNSLPDRSYDNTQSYIMAPSTLETIKSKLPVEQEHFVSTPNGLRMRCESAPRGDWRMTLESSRRYARPFKFEGDTLTF